MGGKTGRRGFLKKSVAPLLALPAGVFAEGVWPRFALALERETGASSPAAVPSYLKGYEDLYRTDPRAAARKWFVEARYGLFIHYTLGSLFPGGKPEIKAAGQVDWKSVQKRFTAEKFDADFIADLALEAGMRYVNLTSRHLGGMALFRTAQSDFTSLTSPAKRDLVGEMAEACRKKGLGFFLYVPPEVAMTDPPNLERNWAQLRELLTQYGLLAGIWFDGISRYYANPQLFSRLHETFALVHSLQPQCLVSFKNGALGEEDFLAPEHQFKRLRGKQSPEAWENLKNKPVEMCTTMQTGRSLWLNREGSKHMTSGDVLAKLKEMAAQKYNFLLNTGPRGDGSIHPDDVRALRESGEQIRKGGFPAADS